jgi:hypothetical protein
MKQVRKEHRGARSKVGKGKPGAVAAASFCIGCGWLGLESGMRDGILDVILVKNVA